MGYVSAMKTLIARNGLLAGVLCLTGIVVSSSQANALEEKREVFPTKSEEVYRLNCTVGDHVFHDLVTFDTPPVAHHGG